MLRAVANPAAGGQPGSFTTLTVSGAATIGAGLAVTGSISATDNSANPAADIVQNGAGIATRIRPGTDQTLALVIDKAGSTASRLRAFVGAGTGGYTADDPYIWSNNADIHFRTGVGGATEALAMKTTGVLNAPNMPTSSAGLVAGDLWSDGGTIKIV